MKNTDFDDFLASSQAQTDQPHFVADTRKTILERMNPPWPKLLRKTLWIHLFSSLVTLSLCNQMGVRLFFDGPGLMEYFMNLGFWTCMGLCGAFYMGSTFLLLSLFSDLDERNKFRKQLPVLGIALSVLSLSVLVVAGASVSAGIILVWLLGAELSCILAFNLGAFIRKTSMA